MDESIADRIGRRLTELGKSERAASLEAGLSEGFLRNVRRGLARSPRGENLERIASVLETSVAWLLSGGDTTPSPHSAASRSGDDISTVRAAPNLPTTFQLSGGPRDIPVRGIAVGGEDADFTMNGDEIDRVKRPLGLVHARDVYGLYVSSDSMAPKFEDGELILVGPHRQPSIGDFVVVELYPEQDGEPGRGFIKRLKARTPTLIVVEQFNPPREIQFDRRQVKNLHRVIPWPEAVGF